ncbi:phage antirepressor N-terminal domain-containing protein [Dictyobacter formicarum]|uniref:Antirepressor protein ant N-terminal domain-containing protein n=1 Tax=Dictyobacter formicarum TaxID=2778368 RepID=A0ABQ3VQ31_9CHLR|nr:phage antirepressor N-terminal domain-containing protein [Dictyobacter formicarum]GHO88225.1 hypothetical protein KSZ_62310 [Dictyobacter formicarum]
MQHDTRNGNRQPQTVLEPIIQEDIPFHDHTITAVRLEDGRIAVVLRWVCEILNMNPQAQTQRIERTTAIANELVRVKVQPRQAGSKGGGRQTMPALTLRGFPVWILGINPHEVADGDDPQRAAHIREMIIAYQLEAVDVLYQHFAAKDRLALPAPTVEARTVIVPAAEPMKPQQEPPQGATDEELASYYEDLAVWAYWKAKQHAQAWRKGLSVRLEDHEARLEAREAVEQLIPEILDRLGPEVISIEQQRQVQVYVKKLHDATGKPYGTIYDELKTAFDCPRYQEIRADEWEQVKHWFLVQFQRAKDKR